MELVLTENLGKFTTQIPTKKHIHIKLIQTSTKRLIRNVQKMKFDHFSWHWISIPRLYNFEERFFFFLLRQKRIVRPTYKLCKWDFSCFNFGWNAIRSSVANLCAFLWTMNQSSCNNQIIFYSWQPWSDLNIISSSLESQKMALSKMNFASKWKSTYSIFHQKKSTQRNSKRGENVLATLARDLAKKRPKLKSNAPWNVISITLDMKSMI